MKINNIKLLLVLLFFVEMVEIKAQYLCIQTSKGIIANASNLTVGANISSEVQLIFSTKTDKALFMDTKGKLWQASSENLEHDTLLLSNAMREYKGYETRGFRKTEDRVLDLKTYFGSGKFTVIGNRLEILLDAKKYPLNNNQFVVFYYKIDEKQVSKKVGFDNQKLVLEKDKLLTSGNALNSGSELRNLVVYTHIISKKETEAITKIHLGFVEKETLKQELNIIKNWAATNAISDVEACLSAFFSAVYGRCDVKQWNDVVLN